MIYNRESISKYMKANDIEPYHGSEFVDALRHLANQPYPEPVAQIVQEQYEEAILNMGASRIKGFSRKLYTMLNGNESPIISEPLDTLVIESLDYNKNKVLTTICYVTVRIPYFTRLNAYWKSIKHNYQVKDTYECIDVVSNGNSLLRDAINCQMSSQKEPGNTNGSYTFAMPWVMDEVQYMLTVTGGFFQPYNGISASKIVQIGKEMKGRNSGYYNHNYNSVEDNETRRNWANRSLIQGLEYYVGKEIVQKYMMLDERDVDAHLKELSKTMKDLWL